MGILRSMTAYTRLVKETALGRMTLEIQSLNRKYFEIQTSLPSSLSAFEVEIRKWVGSEIKRGAIIARLTVAPHETFSLTPNLALAYSYKCAWEEIAKALNLSLPSDKIFDLLKNVPEILQTQERLSVDDLSTSSLKIVFDEALLQLNEMKIREGQALETDIRNRLDLLFEILKAIQAVGGEATERYRLKLENRLKEAFKEVSLKDEDQDRLLKEVCLFAEKTDIAEEITRFESHLNQFIEVLNGSEIAIGKTLEFLLQELQREVNTIGSKTADSEIKKLVVTAKTEIERIREQIQNVE